MMEKNFLDVFPDLEAGRELSALLEEVVVTKVAVNPEKTISGSISGADSGSIKNISIPWKRPYETSFFPVCLCR